MLGTLNFYFKIRPDTTANAENISPPNFESSLDVVGYFRN